MNIIWSPTARKNLDELVLFLEEKWDSKVIIKLFKQLDDSLKLISENPYLFPVVSHKKQIRKCLVRKRTLIFFRIKEKTNSVELILLIDGRANPLKYRF
jgi:plasmid stabilization system protein ParE